MLGNVARLPNITRKKIALPLILSRGETLGTHACAAGRLYLTTAFFQQSPNNPQRSFLHIKTREAYLCSIFLETSRARKRIKHRVLWAAVSARPTSSSQGRKHAEPTFKSKHEIMCIVPCQASLKRVGGTVKTEKNERTEPLGEFRSLLQRAKAEQNRYLRIMYVPHRYVRR